MTHPDGLFGVRPDVKTWIERVRQEDQALVEQLRDKVKVCTALVNAGTQVTTITSVPIGDGHDLVTVALRVPEAVVQGWRDRGGEEGDQGATT